MILAIIQARMSSTRLPGKVMKEIAGKPMIGHLLERLSWIKSIDKMVLATSVLPENDPMAQYARDIGLAVYRGSEEDVLDRFYQVAKQDHPKIIVRLTGDCPLIDPQVCEELITTFQKGRFDYGKTGPTFAEGLDCEVCTFQALAKAWNEASLQSEREHVTLYFYNHPELFKTLILDNKTDDSRYRLSVDEERDFLVATAIFEHFKREKRQCFLIDDIKTFLDAHDDILRLNADIVRNEGLVKSLKNDRVISSRVESD